MNIIDELKAMGDAAIAAQAGSLGGQVDMLASAGRLTARQARYANDLIQQARDNVKAAETANDEIAEDDILETVYGDAEVLMIWDSIAHEKRMVQISLWDENREITIPLADVKGILA